MALRHFSRDGHTFVLLLHGATSPASSSGASRTEPSRIRIVHELISPAEMIERVERAPGGGAFPQVSETRFERKRLARCPAAGRHPPAPGTRGWCR